MPPSALSADRTVPLRFAITCSAEKPLLAVLRRFVVSVAEEIGFSDDDLLKIEMAVDEACSNALIHGYPNRAPGEEAGVDMNVLIEPDALTIQIRDYGRESAAGSYKGADTFDDYVAPNRSDYQGLGILIMKKFMDEVQFLAIPNTGTMVTLRKRRGSSGEISLTQTTPMTGR